MVDKKNKNIILGGFKLIHAGFKTPRPFGSPMDAGFFVGTSSAFELK
jgi:hypothetical protein